MSAGKVSVGHPVDVATGEMFDVWNDAHFPGTKAITFTRRYSTLALERPPTGFGKGWTCNWFVSLRKEGDDYVFTNPEGAQIRFPDPAGAAWAGTPVRNLGAFCEILREGGLLTVVSWNPAAHASERYQFLPGDPGKAWPLRSLVDPAGNAIDLGYDGQGRLQTVRQRREKRGFLLRYNDAGRISELEVAGGNVRRLQVRFLYDTLGRLVRADHQGSVETFEYDDKDRMIRSTTRKGGEFAFTYDDQGRCIRATGKDGFYDRVFRYLQHLGWTEVTDTTGAIWRYEYLPTGQVVHTLSPMGSETFTAFDGEGRIVETTDSNGAKATREYTDAGDYASVTNALGETTRFEHNHRHQLTRLIDALGHGWTLEYDPAGRVIASTDAGGGKWTTRHDANGAPVSIRNSLGHERTFTYDGNGDVIQWTDWKGGAYGYAYDGLGRVLSRTDPLGRAFRFAYDDRDNIISASMPWGGTKRFEYDGACQLTSRTEDTGLVTRYKWGTCGRLLKSIDPSGAVRKYWWSKEPDRIEKVIDEKGREYRFEYDADGRPVRETDYEGRVFEREFAAGFDMVLARAPGGIETAYEYDLLRRVIKKTGPDGAATEYVRGPRALLLSAANPAAKVEFEYDALGRMIKEIQGPHTVVSEYDSEHSRVLCRSSLGHEARFAYDPNQELAGLNLEGRWDFGFLRDAVGREVRRDLPGGGMVAQGFDAQDRMLEQYVEHPARGRDLPVAGGKAESYLLGPDQAAMRIFRSFEYAPDDSAFTVRDAHRGETAYGYDKAGRLTSASRSSGRNETFDYDPAGNATRYVRLPGPRDEAGPDHGDQDCEYGPGNLLLRKGPWRYAYDEAGRMIRRTLSADGRPDQVWEFAWNGDGLMSQVTVPDGGVWKYAYDPFGRRVSKEGPGGAITRFVWDGDTLLHEIGPDGKVRTWTFDDNHRPFSVIADGAIGLYVNDPGGTPQEIIRPDGTVIWAAAYASWGGIDSQIVGGIENPWRFPGQWYDAESGLHYNRWRYYDPSTGRFVSPDPLRIAGGLNTYQYAPSPTHWQDPFGLDTTTRVPGAKPGQFFEVTRDNQGRIIRTSGPLADPAKLPEDQRLRSEYQQRILADKVPGDDAGHLIGDQFGGPGDDNNLVSMCRTSNQTGAWKQMENDLVTIRQGAKKVVVTVNVHYDGDDRRPSKFTVTAKITNKDGSETTRRWLQPNC